MERVAAGKENGSTTESKFGSQDEEEQKNEKGSNVSDKMKMMRIRRHRSPWQH